MYKRPARVLFVAESDAGRSERIAQLTNTHHRDFLRARSAASWAETSSADLAWADLVITLDERARHEAAVLKTGKPTRHWPEPAGETEEAITDALERLESMVGGMRMLARLDEQDQPGAPGPD